MHLFRFSNCVTYNADPERNLREKLLDLRPGNLKGMCQRCHLAYHLEDHQERWRIWLNRMIG